MSAYISLSVEQTTAEKTPLARAPAMA